MPNRPSVPTVDDLRPVGGLRFLEPEEPASDPTSLPPMDPDQQTAEGWVSTSPSSGPDVDEGAKSDDRTSSKGSSADLLDAQVLTGLARGLVSMAGDELHDLLARDEAAQAVELWKTDEQDDELIADPLVSIIKRHTPAVDGLVGDSDAADGITAMVGLAIYGIKQLGRWRAARTIRRDARRAAAAAQAAAEAAMPQPAEQS